MKYFLFITMLYGVSAFPQAAKTNVNVQSKETLLDKNVKRIRELEDSLGYVDSRKHFDLRFELFGRYLRTDTERAMIHLDSCIALANESGDSLFIVKTYNARGTVLENRGELKEAIQIFEEALLIARRNGFSDQVMYLLNNLALSHTAIASFDAALKYNLESLKIREKEADAIDISIALNNIGIVYKEMKDYENALKFFERSYHLKIENHVRYDLERTLVNIGLVLIEIGQYNNADLKIQEAFRICNELVCRPDILLEAYAAAGKVSIYKKQYLLAEKYFLKSLDLSRSPGLSNYRATNYHWLAVVNFLNNRLDMALEYLGQSEVIARKSGFQNVTLDNYLLYAKIYKKQGRFSKAFDFQNRHNELNSEIVNGNLIRKISQVEMEFAERENNAKLATQSKIMALQRDAIDQHKLLNSSLGVLALITIVLVIVLIKLNRRKHEINLSLDQKVRDRTFELEKSSESLMRSYNEQAIVMKRIEGELLAMRATFRGLSNNASKDLDKLDALYFEKAETTIESVLGYVKPTLDKYMKGNATGRDLI